VAAAIHAGHYVRPEVLPHLSVSRAGRHLEEDPFTDLLAEVAETRIVGHRSRFEVDLNRPRSGAVYLRPEDAWGIAVWHETPLPDIVEGSLAIYDEFYAAVEKVLQLKIQEYGAVVVYDIHSYNHRRSGPDGPPDDPEENPEVNIGTGTLDRARWGPLVDRFKDDLRHGAGRGELDVRENVKFRGGNFPTWVHARFAHQACAIAIEFKKTFMNEWTGELDTDRFASLRQALAGTIPGVLDELGLIAATP